jgi:hypothetical protein
VQFSQNLSKQAVQDDTAVERFDRSNTSDTGQIQELTALMQDQAYKVLEANASAAKAYAEQVSTMNALQASAATKQALEASAAKAYAEQLAYQTASAAQASAAQAIREQALLASAAELSIQQESAAQLAAKRAAETQAALQALAARESAAQLAAQQTSAAIASMAIDNAELGDNPEIGHFVLPKDTVDQTIQTNSFIGRYIRVKPSKLQGDGYLQLSQIIVYDTSGNNAALGQPIYSNNTNVVSMPAYILVNGNTNAHTFEQGLWTSTGYRGDYIEVDIGKYLPIKSIRLIGRADTVPGRMFETRIEINRLTSVDAAVSYGLQINKFTQKLSKSKEREQEALMEATAATLRENEIQVALSNAMATQASTTQASITQASAAEASDAEESILEASAAEASTANEIVQADLSANIKRLNSGAK